MAEKQRGGGGKGGVTRMPEVDVAWPARLANAVLTAAVTAIAMLVHVTAKGASKPFKAMRGPVSPMRSFVSLLSELVLVLLTMCSSMAVVVLIVATGAAVTLQSAVERAVCPKRR